jgi:predicted nucleic acid-binding protein
MTRRTIRVYVDSSVFGGVQDTEFARPSNLFFDAVREHKIQPVISALVVRELDMAPPLVITMFQETLPLAEVVEVDPQSLALRDAYLRAKILATRWSTDALHVAVATVNNCTAIVSWNFKHIVNYRRIPLYNAINRIEGYQELAIYSPWEVIGEEAI